MAPKRAKYTLVCERERECDLGLCLVGRHLKVALPPSNFFERESDGPICYQAWSDQNSPRGEKQVLSAKTICTCHSNLFHGVPCQILAAGGWRAS